MKKEPAPVKKNYIEHRKVGDMVLVIVSAEELFTRDQYPGYFAVVQWVESNNGKKHSKRLLALTAELRDAWRVFFAHEVK